ncbi:MAG: hypothetical protein ACXAB7_24520, partial [Candidatus Kariarchaeaceae archaeon]
MDREQANNSYILDAINSLVNSKSSNEDLDILKRNEEVLSTDEAQQLVYAAEKKTGLLEEYNLDMLASLVPVRIILEQLQKYGFRELDSLLSEKSKPASDFFLELVNYLNEFEDSIFSWGEVRKVFANHLSFIQTLECVELFGRILFRVRRNREQFIYYWNFYILVVNAFNQDIEFAFDNLIQPILERIRESTLAQERLPLIQQIILLFKDDNISLYTILLLQTVFDIFAIESEKSEPDLNEAIELYEIAIDLFENPKYTKEIVNLYQESQLYFKRKVVKDGVSLVMAIYDIDGVNWNALMHQEIATYYLDRLKPNDIQHSIRHFDIALGIFKKTSDVDMWAKAEKQFIDMLLKADQIELGIRRYKSLLSSIDKNEYPRQWAFVLLNLTETMIIKMNPNRHSDIDDAIILLTNAIDEWDKKKYPQYWGMMLHDLGLAYFESRTGDRIDNLKLSIELNKQA